MLFETRKEKERREQKVAKESKRRCYGLNMAYYFLDGVGVVRRKYVKSPKGKSAIKAAKRLTHEKGFYRKQREANA